MRARLILVSTAVLSIAACAGSDDTATSVADPADDATTASTIVEPPMDTAPTSVAPTTEPPADTTPPTTEPELAEFEAIGPGEYDVGVTTFTVAGASDRPLTVDVWFPIDASDAATAAPPHQYTLLPGVYYESPRAVSADVSQISTDGPFPLVVYSHGSGGLRYIASSYTEALASHGYVVAAPDHTGNTAVDRLLGTDADFDVNAFDRPNDIGVVIDAMVDPANAETAGIGAAVDADAIAVTGHSFGGFTAMAMASGYTNPVGSVPADPRVDAVIAFAPASGDGSGRLLSDADLAAITVPMLLMVGTNDATTPIDPNVTRPWELSGSDVLSRVELTGAAHNSFTDICDYQRFLPTLGDVVPPPVTETIEAQAAEGCGPESMPIERVQELTNTFAVDFLDVVFGGGELIEPATVVVPDDVAVLVR